MGSNFTYLDVRDFSVNHSIQETGKDLDAPLSGSRYDRCPAVPRPDTVHGSYPDQTRLDPTLTDYVWLKFSKEVLFLKFWYILWTNYETHKNV